MGCTTLMTVFGMESRNSQCSSVAGFNAQQIASTLPASSIEGRATIPAPYLTGRHTLRGHIVSDVSRYDLNFWRQTWFTIMKTGCYPRRESRNGCVQWTPGSLVHKNQNLFPRNEHSSSDIILLPVQTAPQVQVAKHPRARVSGLSEYLSPTWGHPLCQGCLVSPAWGPFSKFPWV
ncbi:hypothetical protein GHT09_000803 [Marmota monax]|uniref:Uncharacterized protein n=1 Tax=Marmota monax TaxID=9995 RepID=A0A834URN2_MARMO|nr:hypothetical protein GHT09_000803 [Marmota monax]